MIFRKFPMALQLDAADCGPACLMMVARHYGKVLSRASVCLAADLDREGTTLYGLSEAARRNGLDALPVRVASCQGLPLPCILHWEANHFVVLLRMGRKRAWIADPASGIYPLPEAVFYEKWKGGEAEGHALLLLPGSDWKPEGGGSWPESMLAYIKPYRKWLWQIAVGILLISAIQLLFPFLAQLLVDYGIEGGDPAFILWLLAGQFLLTGSQMGASALLRWMALHIGERIHLSMLNRFLERFFRLDLAEWESRPAGDWLQRMGDHSRIGQFFSFSALQAAFSFFYLLVFGLALAFFSPAILGVYALGSVIFLAWVFGFGKSRARLDQILFQQRAKQQQNLVELAEGFRDIRLHRQGPLHLDKWSREQGALFQTQIRLLQVLQWQDIGGALISHGKDLLILGLSAWSVVEGRMTLGMLLAIQYIIGQLNAPLLQIIAFSRSWQDARLSLERAADMPLEKEDPREDIGPGAGLVLEGVYFRYPGSRDWTLRDIHLECQPGSITGFTGVTGSGKSTLLKLALGLYEAQEGRVYGGGRTVAAVFPDSPLFSDTLMANIAGEPNPDPDRLKEALYLSCADELARELPRGLETRIGGNEWGLSQGQKQRVLLARAIYSNPDLLVLDEATAALDIALEKEFWKRIKPFLANRITLVAAHRETTLQQADRILAVKNGRLSEEFSPGEKSPYF